MRTLLAASMRAHTGGWPASTRLLIGAAAGALCVAAFLSLSIGATGITLTSLPRVLSAMLTASHEADVAREQLVLIDIRLPRMLLGMFVGAALAVAGAMMQGMFRNPLADPGLVGVLIRHGIGCCHDHCPRQRSCLTLDQDLRYICAASSGIPGRFSHNRNLDGNR